MNVIVIIACIIATLSYMGLAENVPITRNLSNGNLEKRTKTNEKEY